jgi:hypothetical protein
VLGPLSALALERFTEYRLQTSREARFARACDRLHLGVRWIAYRREGARGLADFRATIERLECGEFAPCAELRAELLSAADRLDAGRDGRA